MIIRELTRQASLDLLKRVHLGRLACTKANQPYIVPIGFAYDNNSLYCAGTVGQKIEWMRENPLVAVEVDEIKSAQQWESVVISGEYEELSDEPNTLDARQRAWALLQTANALWWEPGYVKTILGSTERRTVPLFFRIRIAQMTGHRANSE